MQFRIPNQREGESRIQKRTMDRLIRGLIVVTALVFLLLLVAAGFYVRGRRSAVDVPQAAKAPEQEAERPTEPKLYQVFDGALTDENGTRITLASLRGKPVALVFWSSWCDDCKGFLQNEAEQLFADARAAGMHAYLVCREGRRGETWESARSCLRELGIQQSTLMDEGGRVFDDLGLNRVPSIAILDEEGRLTVSTHHMPDADAFQAMIRLTLDGAQAQSEAFLRESLMDGSGAICSSHSVRDNQVVRGPSILSETQGLMMLYAVRQNDQALFDHLLGYVRDVMTVNGLAVWRINPDNDARVNASLDDLRILEALQLAEEAWGGYEHELSFRETALYRCAVRDGHMRDYVELDSRTACQTVTLCYLDVAAMERLAGAYPKWETPASNAREVLANGRISEAFPLYYPRFSPETGRYEGDWLQMNEALVTLYHMAKAGMDCEASLDWLEAQMEQGAVYAAYTLDGTPADGYAYESLATYALLVQTAQLCGRDGLASMALARVESKRCFTAPLVGDFGSIADAEHYAFDLIQALLAWQSWNAR